MASLVLNTYSPLLDDSIKTESGGDMSSPIWVLLNPRYSGIRHYIWTPILEEIQDRVFRKLEARIDTKNIFIKSVASNIGIISNSINCGAGERKKEIEIFRKTIRKCQPRIIITLGTITYEFVRRVFELNNEKEPQYWSSTNLGNEFERSIENFDINKINMIPLVSRVIKNGKLFEDANYSNWQEIENYFHYVGLKIADRIIENKDRLNLWIN